MRVSCAACVPQESDSRGWPSPGYPSGSTKPQRASDSGGKTVLIDDGLLRIEVPCERDGCFASVTHSRHQRSFTDFDPYGGNRSEVSRSTGTKRLIGEVWCVQQRLSRMASSAGRLGSPATSQMSAVTVGLPE